MLQIRTKAAIAIAVGIVFLMAAGSVALISIQLSREKYSSKVDNLEYLRKALQGYYQNAKKQNDGTLKSDLPETLDGLVKEGYLNGEDLRVATNGIEVNYNPNYQSKPNEWVLVAHVEDKILSFPLYGQYKLEKK